MECELKNWQNKNIGTVKLQKAIFGCDPREDIVSRVIHWQLAKRRSGTHCTKRIGDVSGTTKKPFRQKGTGNARQGSLRSPHMRGGATMHGPLNRSYGYALPKKIRIAGLKSALSAKFISGDVLIINDLSIKDGKTKSLISNLKKLNLTSGLFVDEVKVDESFLKASANIYKINAIPVCGLNVYDIVRHEKIILTKSAVDNIGVRLG